MTDLRKLLEDARSALYALGEKHYDNIAKRIDAALAEKVEPVEPDFDLKHFIAAVKNTHALSINCSTRLLKAVIAHIDSLQSALKLAQEEKIFAETMLKDYRGAFTMQQERAEKAESLNRRMVEQYRDLVAAAEKIGGKVTDASNLQISIADVLSMKEALAKLEEA